MDSPQGDIPLDQAVDRQLIPCSVCGRKGADVRQVEGKKHFLCAPCAARGRRWTLGVIGAAVALAAVVVGVRLTAPAATPTGQPGSAVPLPGSEELKALETRIGELMRDKKFRDAQGLLAPLLDKAPDAPMLNLFMGRCCYALGQYELSLAAWPRAARDPKNEEECRFRTGEALQQLGYSSRARAFLEKPFSLSPYQESRNNVLVTVLTDLEEYDPALALLDAMPADASVRYYRHRVLLYRGRPEEARKAFDGADSPADRMYRAQALALQAREEGDFPGALKILDEAVSKLDAGSIDSLRLRRSRLAVYSESGDLATLEKEATDLIAAGEPRTLGEALWYRALARLAAGKPDLAKADAAELLEKSDRSMGWLRLEILTLEHLLGRRKDEDIDREARALNRFRANDLYYYLALATGKTDWAEKALAATPGHNAPYHAIKRLLKGK